MPIVVPVSPLTTLQCSKVQARSPIAASIDLRAVVNLPPHLAILDYPVRVVNATSACMSGEGVGLVYRSIGGRVFPLARISIFSISSKRPSQHRFFVGKYGGSSGRNL